MQTPDVIIRPQNVSTAKALALGGIWTRETGTFMGEAHGNTSTGRARLKLDPHSARTGAFILPNCLPEHTSFQPDTGVPITVLVLA